MSIEYRVYHEVKGELEFVKSETRSPGFMGTVRNFGENKQPKHFIIECLPDDSALLISQISVGNKLEVLYSLKKGQSREIEASVDGEPRKKVSISHI